MTHPLPSDPEEAATLGTKLGIESVAESAEKTILRMPVAGNTQPTGILHGGATAALCEEAASRAAGVHAAEVGRSNGTNMVAVGTSLAVTHLRPAKSDEITATATAQHLGRRTTVHEVKVRDSAGSLVSAALMTNQIVELP